MRCGWLHGGTMRDHDAGQAIERGPRTGATQPAVRSQSSWPLAAALPAPAAGVRSALACAIAKMQPHCTTRLTTNWACLLAVRLGRLLQLRVLLREMHLRSGMGRPRVAMQTQRTTAATIVPAPCLSGCNCRRRRWRTAQTLPDCPQLTSPSPCTSLVMAAFSPLLRDYIKSRRQADERRVWRRSRVWLLRRARTPSRAAAPAQPPRATRLG